MALNIINLKFSRITIIDFSGKNDQSSKEDLNVETFLTENKSTRKVNFFYGSLAQTI